MDSTMVSQGPTIFKPTTMESYNETTGEIVKNISLVPSVSMTTTHNLYTDQVTSDPDQTYVLYTGRSIFYIIHVSAIVSCYASTIASFATVVFLFLEERLGKKRRFYRWTTGERLVVYLAMADIFFSISHGSDHVYVVSTEAKPPQGFCMLFSALTTLFMFDQNLIILYTAVSAFLLVYYQKKINLGRFDWRLHVYSLGPPFIYSVLGHVYGYLGFNGLWCVQTVRNALGVIMGYTRSGFQGFVFLISLLCYTAICLKMRSSGPVLEAAEKKERKKKNKRSAKVMMVFVLANILQWWSVITYNLWVFWEPPPEEFFVTLVFLVNFGGVYNALAYTVMRRKYLTSTKKKPVEAVPSIATISTRL